MSLLKRWAVCRVCSPWVALHSTMSLLKPNARSCPGFGSLPLHSTMSLLKRFHKIYPCSNLLALHSTMSLLKLTYWLPTVPLVESFTFHYVSIKTFRPYLPFAILRNFTFHYVSIKTLPFLPTALFHLLSLHSTMSLLKLFLLCCLCLTFLLYIPLCLY